MTETDTSIRVDDRTFADREELADYVAGFVGNRVYDPTELKAIQRLATLANGGAPEGVHEIARATTFHSPGNEREPTPFDARIEELDEQRQADEEAWQVEVAALGELRRKIRHANRRTSSQNVPRAERQKAREEVERLRAQLPAQNEKVNDARKVATRSRAAWRKAKLAADRWRADRAARFVVGSADDRRVVDREGLMEFLDAERNR